MSISLFKLTLKKKWPLFVIFFCVLTMYTTVIIGMYNPDDMAAIQSLKDTLPEEIMSAFGMGGLVTDLTGLVASWLYGMLMVGFPMVYSIILSNGLVAKSVDSGSMACLLASPLSRTKIIATKGAYALISVAMLQICLMGVSIVTCQLMFPDMLKIAPFVSLNITTMLVNMVAMSITFFFSCLFNDSKYSAGFGTAVPLGFLLMKMLADAGENAKFLKAFSIYGWYDPNKLAQGESYMAINIVYISLIVILFSASILIFRKKRLPL